MTQSAISASAKGVAHDDISLSFTRAMRQLAATVTIITTNHGGRRWGMTATAVTSLCAEPASLLICINRAASIHPALNIGTRFCINVLGSAHADLSMAFGGKAEPEIRFAHGVWKADVFSVPYLADSQANIFCTVEQAIVHGTHSVLVGNVYRADAQEAGEPLVYGNGRFANPRAWA